MQLSMFENKEPAPAVFDKEIKRYWFEPSTLKESNRFIKKHHRHSNEIQGHRFSIKVLDQEGEMFGVVVAGRPTARRLDQYLTLEVTRLCLVENAPKNMCSQLYSRVARAATAQGYLKLYTYTLEEERGSSLRSAGFRFDAFVEAANWHRESRPRGEAREAKRRIRWVRDLNPPKGGLKSIVYKCRLNHEEEHLFVDKEPDHIVCNACIFDSEDINYAYPIDNESICDTFERSNKQTE